MCEELSYVLITPARNEERLIEKTISSVVAQTIRPRRWVIVSDGSLDRTDEIVGGYSKQHEWIDFLKMPESRNRNFAAKVKCFNAGWQHLSELEYDIIGNLDADISFDVDYFEFLLSKFAEIPELGVAGTPFVEGSTHYDYRFANIEHVSGACQLFRRRCFEDIGGYRPIERGGIDWVAVTTARMKGWKTRTFVEKTCAHHRQMGTSKRGALMACFKQGEKDYLLGGHPLWEVLRSCYQMSSRPYFLHGFLLLLGFSWACVRRIERPIPLDLIKFHRREQLFRLRRIVRMTLSSTKRFTCLDLRV